MTTYTNETGDRTIRLYGQDIVLVLKDSSMLKVVQYHPEMGNTLAVVFNNDTLYHYYGVPFSVMLALMGADSVGKEFNALVKQGGYEYTNFGVGTWRSKE